MTTLRLVCLSALALAVAGCGSGGVVVTGTVTLGEQPLQTGVIALEPEAGSGTTGPGASVTIQDGTFVFEKSKKLTPGRYVLRVSPAPLFTGTDLKTAPPRFRPWEKKVELASGSNPMTLDLPDSQASETR